MKIKILLLFYFAQMAILPSLSYSILPTSPSAPDERRNVLDQYGNPNFFSITIDSKEFEDFVIYSGYYTIMDNISNPSSAAFVSEDPDTAMIFNFCTKTLPYFWMVHINQTVSKGVMLLPKVEEEKIKWYWVIIDLVNKTQKEIPTHFKGNITEHRFLELSNIKTFKEKVLKGELELMDPIGIDKNEDYVSANYKGMKVISYRNIYQELVRLIRENNLWKPEVDVLKIEIK